MKNNLVILLTKFPEPGKVKTRLGKTIGLKKACKIQEKFINHILKNNYKNKYYYDFKIGLRGKENIQKFSENFGVQKDDIFTQIGEDLGVMMNNAIKYGLKDYKRVVIIGSDIPTLREGDFKKTFDILEKENVVIGKANDGGYYLIGMKKENEELFKNIVYSTPSVFEETINKIKENNLSHKEIEEKIDIDTIKDLILAGKQDKTGFLTQIIKECET